MKRATVRVGGKISGNWVVFARGLLVLLAYAGTACAADAPLDQATAIQQVDAAVQMRVDKIAGYSVTEHYAVFRGQDETHPVAEMTVKTTSARDGQELSDSVAERFGACPAAG